MYVGTVIPNIYTFICYILYVHMYIYNHVCNWFLGQSIIWFYSVDMSNVIYETWYIYIYTPIIDYNHKLMCNGM